MKELNLKNLPDLAKEISYSRRMYESYNHQRDLDKWNALAKQFHEDPTTQTLEAILTEKQGRARERILTTYDLCLLLANVQEQVSTKKALNGTKVNYDFGQHFPNAYKYTPQSTHMTAEYRNGTWRLTAVERGTCPNRSNAGTIEFSESAKQDILDRASRITELI